MRLSELFMPTIREIPSEAEVISHVLMLRAGLIRRQAAGIYNFLPLGNRVLRKVENIIREEMDRAGAQEVLLSAVIPRELMMETGRWDIYGRELFKFKDRNDRDFCLGPTHEEVITDLVRNGIKSYRDLPKNLYQIQTKYRDERRPRFGVMRSREFIMKDAYSFDRDWEGLDVSYRKMYEAYCKIFDRCGLKYKVVEADSGAIGGRDSHEFMVISEVGEATIAYCDTCGYAANVERAECVYKSLESKGTEFALETVHTPNVRTIEELERFFNVDKSRFVKTLIYKVKDRVVAVLIRGDRELNEVKLINLLKCTEEELEMADVETIKEVTGAEVGFAGPIDLKNVTIIMDKEVEFMKNFITGANKTDYHFVNVNYPRDFVVDAIADVRKIQEGDFCPKCGDRIKIDKGIEVGHIFKLGLRYSQAMNANYIDENGEEKPIVMGCYGIGVARTIAAIIEQNSDENGIIWPISVAPYHIIVVPVSSKDEVQRTLAEKIYNDLKQKGYEVLIDDRNESAGVKFKDADLIGIPIRITVGRKAKEGIVEFKLRWDEKAIEINIDEVQDRIDDVLKR